MNIIEADNGIVVIRDWEGEGARRLERGIEGAGVFASLANSSLLSTGIPYECQFISQLLQFPSHSLFVAWQGSTGWP